MAFDTKKWLGSLGFTPEEIADLEPKFGPRADKLDAADRQIATTQAALKVKDDQLTAEMAQWAELQGENTKEADKLRKDLEQTRVEKSQIEARLRTLAESTGQNVDDLLKPAAAAVTTPAPAAIDPTQFVAREQMGPLVDLLLKNPAELMQIAHEHQTLFGTALPDTTSLVNELVSRLSKKQQTSLRSIWEEQYKVPDKRTEVAETRRQADLKAARDEGYEKARSESALPTSQHPAGTHAGVFKVGDGKPKAPGVEQARGNRTLEFAQKLRSGAFRKAG